MGVILPSAGPAPRTAEAVAAEDKKPTPPKKRSVIIRMDKREPTRDDVRQWLAVQIPYENLAEDEQVADRARTYVNKQLTYYQSASYGVKDKWRALDYLLRGTSLSRQSIHSDIHVPELYKAVETLVPRIEEAVTQNGVTDFFSVKGRDEVDQRQAWRIQAWLQHLLKMGQIDEMQQEMIRCLLVYGFWCVKSWWDIRFEDRIHRSHEKLESKGGAPRYRITAEEQEKLVYYGPRYALVDPYDFIVDTTRTDAQEGLFVGDVSEITLEELRELEKLGMYTNVAGLEEQKPQKVETGAERLYSKYERSLSVESRADRSVEGQPEMFERTQMACLFDPYGRGNAEEYLITVVNGETVVEVRRNHHDDKHRPYAVARAAREPFDFHNVGPLDHAVRLNIEMDEHRALGMRGHENSLMPMVFANENDELPPNIWDADPGSVFRCAQPPTFFQAPPVVDIMAKMDEVSRRDIEETVGAPRVYEGQAGSDETATGIVRKIEEANRRTRGLIRAHGGGLKQIVAHTWAMSAQFTTRRETFRVLGALAAGNKLGPFSDIGPEETGLGVDFDLLGLASLHTQGLRATNMATFFGQIYPIAAQFVPPEEIDWSRLMQLFWDMTVGMVPGEDIFRSQQRLAELLDPEEENMLLIQGLEVRVQEGDQDRQHEATHADLVAMAAQKKDEDLLRRALEHVAAHRQQAARKRQRQAALEEMRERMPNGRPAADRAGSDQKGRSGRDGDFNTSVAQTPPGEAPGPPNQQTTAAADRTTAVPQTQNQAYGGSAS